MNSGNAQRGRSGQSSLAEVLFSERVDAVLSEREWDLISEHHQFYMLCLLHTHCRLKQLVDRYFGDLLDDADADTVALQKEFEGLYPVPDLQIDAKMTSIQSAIAPQQHGMDQVLEVQDDSKSMSKDDVLGNGPEQEVQHRHRHEQSVSSMFGIDSGSLAMNGGNGRNSSLNLNGKININPVCHFVKWLENEQISEINKKMCFLIIGKMSKMHHFVVWERMLRSWGRDVVSEVT